jgi:hypothetical protein
MDGSVELGTADLVDTGSGFAAQLIPAHLTVGVHHLSARYNESAYFAASSSAAVDLTIEPAPISYLFVPLVRK